MIKSIIIGKKNVAGRNSSGKITVHHKGGGHKKKFRKIDFLRNTDSTGIVTSLEYDPYRTAFIASVYDFLNRRYFFMLAPKNLNIGDVVIGKNLYQHDLNASPFYKKFEIPILKLPHVNTHKSNLLIEATEKFLSSYFLVSRSGLVTRLPILPPAPKIVMTVMKTPN